MTEEIKNQILAIRDTGATNMFDIRNVKNLCDQLGFDELKQFINRNSNAYYQFILTGKS